MPDDISQLPEMLAGGCMCGAVRYTIAEKPLATGFAIATAAGRNLEAHSRQRSS
jgi:hypothetical protein